MQGTELTLLLINAFLVILIIVVYVHLAQVIKHDGVQIKVLTQQMAAQKEGMSAAQRMGLAGLYVGKKDNLLVGKEAQIKDPKPIPLYGSSRCNFNASELRNPNIPVQGKTNEIVKSNAASIASSIGTSVATAVQNGANQAAAVTGFKHDDAGNVIDETASIAPQQNGLIDTTKENYTGVNSRVQPPVAFLYRSNGKPIISN